VDLEAVAHTDIYFGGRSGLQVVVANGDHVQSPDCCRNMPLSITNEQFILDCYILALCSFDMVLCVQWLESLGPILWDFTKHMITFMLDSHE
jgi:hypothetical protein